MTESSYSILTFKGEDLPKDYLPLIFSRWLRSLRKGNDLFTAIDAERYYKEYHAFIERLLSKPGTLIKLAVLSDDHDIVLGFSSSREDVLDYVHVHLDQRGQKISNLLIPGNITVFSHITKMWIPIWRSKYKQWKFNPFA